MEPNRPKSYKQRVTERGNKNGGATKWLRAEKGAADGLQHLHFWSQGRDKGRGKPLPLNLGLTGMWECGKKTKSKL